MCVLKVTIYNVFTQRLTLLHKGTYINVKKHKIDHDVTSLGFPLFLLKIKELLTKVIEYPDFISLESSTSREVRCLNIYE